jgi:hypothetical protein
MQAANVASNVHACAYWRVQLVVLQQLLDRPEAGNSLTKLIDCSLTTEQELFRLQQGAQETKAFTYASCLIIRVTGCR